MKKETTTPQPSRVLYTEYFDLDADSKNAKFHIDRDYTVTNNDSGEKLAFPSQVDAINWIKAQPSREVLQDNDLKVCEDAIYRAYDYLFALGYFTTPTDEGRKVENLLIQGRVRILEVKNNYQSLVDSNQLYEKTFNWLLELTPSQFANDLKYIKQSLRETIQ